MPIHKVVNGEALYRTRSAAWCRPRGVVILQTQRVCVRECVSLTAAEAVMAISEAAIMM